MNWSDGENGTEGWVYFRTQAVTTVSDFGGHARIAQVATQAHRIGGSYFVFNFGNGRVGRRELRIPTGNGVALGASWIFAAGMATAGNRKHSNNWDLY